MITFISSLFSWKVFFSALGAIAAAIAIFTFSNQ
ncbi:unnamed protein product, partial [marine sediment metagenome]